VKILALSDKVVRTVYSAQIKELYGDVDLIIGCGDLPYYYLEYVVTMLPVPVAYVYGNHDKEQILASGRVINAPSGCVSLEDRVAQFGDLLVAGLGGSIQYQPGAIHQYTEAEMRRRILRLAPRLLWNRLRHGRYLDILVTHSPPYGIHDGADRAHRGFKSFLTFMQLFKPAYLLHGHVHIYRRGVQVETRYGQTTVINVYPRRVIYWNLGQDNEQ